MMRSVPLAIGAAVAVACLPIVVLAKAAGAIECPTQSLSANQRAGLGAALLGENEDAVTKARGALERVAPTCAKVNRWSARQTGAAIDWGVWALMDAELELRSGLAPADISILRAYVDEDPSRIDEMDRYTDIQVRQLVATLRQRGAKLHDFGNDTAGEIGFLLPLKEMKAAEAVFAAK